MAKRYRTGWLLLVVMAGLMPFAGLSKNTQPNVILLLADDLGFGDIGYTGNEFAATPNIDALIKSGMWFSSGYAPAAQCSPSRAAIMSGQTPGRLHLTTWIPKPGSENQAFRTNYKDQCLKIPRNALPLEVITLAERLKTKGYATISLGKWHIGHKDFAPVDQGFDEQPGWWPWSFPKSWVAPFGLETLMQYRKGTYMADALTDEAIRFVGGHRETPFFMAFQFYSTHAPLSGKPEDVQAMKALGAKSDKKAGYANAKFEAMKISLDENIGRLMSALEELGLAENTAVIFTTDNGGVEPYARNLPFRAGKKHLYEGGIHVPFCIRWPGRTQAGSVCDEPVSSMDLYPTLMEACGVEIADGQPMDGESLLPLLKDPDTPLEREALFWHFPNLSYAGPICVSPRGCVRQGDFKLIVPYHPDEAPELYNLREDPSETKDISARHPERVEDMIRLLKHHLTETQAQMPEPNRLF